MLSSLKLMMQDAGHGYSINQFFDAGNSFSEEIVSSTDTSNNSVYLIKESSVNGVLLSKHDSKNNLLFSKKISISGRSLYNPSIKTDSSGNIFTAFLSLSTDFAVVVSKFNSSGVLQWSKKFTASDSIVCFNLAVDSSGDAYVCGYVSSFSNGYFIKISSSGTVLLQRKITTSNTSVYGLDVDLSGNIYLACRQSVIKLNSSGTIQWQKTLTTSKPNFQISSILNDPVTSAIFICGEGNRNTYPVTLPFICRLDSSGNFVWYNEHIYSGNSIGQNRVIKKSSDEYIYLSSLNSNYEHINKVDKNGGIIFSRRVLVKYVGNAIEFVKGDSQKIKLGIITDKPNNITNYSIADLPSDMSLVGTYRGISITDANVVNDPQTVTISNSSHSTSSTTGITMSNETLIVGDFTPSLVNTIKV